MREIFELWAFTTLVCSTYDSSESDHEASSLDNSNEGNVLNWRIFLKY